VKREVLSGAVDTLEVLRRLSGDPVSRPELLMG